MENFKKDLTSNIWIAMILFIGFLGWILSLDFIAIPILAVYALLLFIFCDDVKNILTIIFAVPFFIRSVITTGDFVVLGVSLGIFIIGVVYYIVKQFMRKVPMKKGNLFWGFVCLLAAYLLGGIIGYFNIINILIIIAMTSLTYFVYWVVINFCKGVKTHISLIFIGIGVLLSIQLFISYLLVEEPFMSAILSKNVISIGLQNINVVAIYFMLSMISVFYFGYKHKYDYLFTLGGLIFAICTYFTYSRMGTLICLLVLLTAVIATFVKSQNKRIYIFTGIVGLFAMILIVLLCYERIEKYLEWHLNLGFSGNGRGTLWPWCLDKFLDSPVFGVGFTSEDPVPSLMTTDSIILAHNSALQYLTSTGIVGTILAIYFYFKKYKIIFTKFNGYKFFNMLNILAIGISGITDQSPTMDFFILTISAVLVALAEIDSDEQPETHKRVVGVGDKSDLDDDFVQPNNGSITISDDSKTHK